MHVLTEAPVSLSDAVLLGYPLQLPMSRDMRLNDLQHYDRVSFAALSISCRHHGSPAWQSHHTPHNAP